jgi:integrase
VVVPREDPPEHAEAWPSTPAVWIAVAREQAGGLSGLGEQSERHVPQYQDGEQTLHNFTLGPATGLRQRGSTRSERGSEPHLRHHASRATELSAWTGLPPLTLHGLRHTFATIGLDAGVDALYVAEMLGHSSPAITMSVYQHVRRDRLNAAMATIAEAIES